MVGTVTIKTIAITVRKSGIIKTGIITITTGSTTTIARPHAIGTGIIMMLLETMKVGVGITNGSQTFEKGSYSHQTCDEPFDLCRMTCMSVSLRLLADTVMS